MVIEAVVCHIRDGDRLLLQRKAAGRFGEGKWNGAGGKLKSGETPEGCAVREVEEETGLRVSGLTMHGSLRFHFGGEQVDWLVHVFCTGSFTGETKPGEEGELRWFKVSEIPLSEMWEDDRHWLYLMLEGKTFEGDFHYSGDGAQITSLSLAIKG